MVNLPDEFKNDIKTAVDILKNEGCSEIYLFGSIPQKSFGPNSDIDLAVRGCPSGKFFEIYGNLIMEMEHKIDLINLDMQKDLAEFLEKQGELVKVG